MHYKNGREAKNGDKVVQIVEGHVANAGILYDAVPGNDSCNGRIALTTQNDPFACLSTVLHVDDIARAEVPDSTKLAGTPATPPPGGWPTASAPITGGDTTGQKPVS